MLEEGSKNKGKIKKIKKEDPACTIFITCKHPSSDGKMSVEMSYEGDPKLASYLLESAQGFIDQEVDK